ncbi:GNAT family N-acetyltransferase [Bifidobacterium callimiconis]|uniref:Histone acetyltransferase HPA2 and related acetyltransferase n=1 Tax=Bifidobacterium callimiconis TaxID=2306973 RepID=A0A430F7W0_9BIFI|nr:GNAT family N-acetyltransferase [Bifidobacterium callimiconis]MBT1178072.1 GNAT family N-acetyltransferase [Bifidobacterium callimiconis]RSX49009.1 Histone acetyltransferase HPA2 and related acetyltransferase [Bifidobacterium callimiconis]
MGRIRRAVIADIPDLDRLLFQVAAVHHEGRPDLFKPNAKKYSDDELTEIIADDERPIFVYEDDADAGDGTHEDAASDRTIGGTIGEPTDGSSDRSGRVIGYAFCVFQRHPGSHVLTDITTLYIDDLCVDENARGKHVGSALYRHVLDFAREQGCYNVTLNVWSCNPSAMAFYEHCGLKPQKVGMETIL